MTKPTLKTRDVYVLIDQHTGLIHGSRFYVSEEHCVTSIQDTGFQYVPELHAIMPATITYRSDR